MRKIIYIRETEETCSIIKRILLSVKKFLNIIKVQDDTMYYLPILRNNKISKYTLKRLTNKINILLEKSGANDIALSECLNSNQLFKNYLYSKNINILDGRFLFKCLIYKIIEYIFKIKNKEMELRGSLIAD